MNAKSAAPIRKVAAGGLSGAIVTIAVWLLSTYANVSMPDTVAAALVTVVSFGVAYLVPSSTSDLVLA